ncbi:TBC13 [Hepatospora eriocheir]|uniref:TBC13 n=1 Tax=Hepatospora eriocheir TaxID=1081669 RepID=A0A1X0QK26_9MICR|nr:TBC13 [Hepatospora eriocheir]
MSTKQKISLEYLITSQMNPTSTIPLNSAEIRNYIYYGFKSDKLRPKYWKILLGYHPKNKFKSDSFYIVYRKSYHTIKIPDNERIKTLKDQLYKDIARTEVFNEKYNCYKEPIRNILLKYIATNQCLGYIQGMINLVIPLYHVLYTSEDLDDKKYAEEDTFYLFHNLMAEMTHPVTEILSPTSDIITEKVQEVYKIVKEKDPKFYTMLESKEVLEMAFPIKWIIQMFTSLYEMDDVVYIWDKLLSDSYHFELLNYCCAAFILLKKKTLKDTNFYNFVEVFKTSSDVPVKELFDIADKLRRSNKSFDVIMKK